MKIHKRQKQLRRKRTHTRVRKNTRMCLFPSLHTKGRRGMEIRSPNLTWQDFAVLSRSFDFYMRLRFIRVTQHCPYARLHFFLIRGEQKTTTYNTIMFTQSASDFSPALLPSASFAASLG